jgi:hypothetical protein
MKAEEARRVEEARKAEEARRAEEARKAEEAQRAEESTETEARKKLGQRSTKGPKKHEGRRSTKEARRLTRRAEQALATSTGRTHVHDRTAQGWLGNWPVDALPGQRHFFPNLFQLLNLCRTAIAAPCDRNGHQPQPCYRAPCRRRPQT